METNKVDLGQHGSKFIVRAALVHVESRNARRGCHGGLRVDDSPSASGGPCARSGGAATGGPS